MGVELVQGKGVSATLTQADFTKNMELLTTSSSLCAGRKEPLSIDYMELRQCKLGELRWVATVPRPDISTMWARIVSRINALCGSDVYRVNVLARVVEDWQQETALKYASPSHPWTALGRGDRAHAVLRKRGERVHGGSVRLEGKMLGSVWFADQSGWISSLRDGPMLLLGPVDGR